jgi:hypothetical protein
VPKGLARENKNSDHDKLKDKLELAMAEWEEEKMVEGKGVFRTRRVLPIVHAQYLMFLKK